MARQASSIIDVDYIRDHIRNPIWVANLATRKEAFPLNKDVRICSNRRYRGEGGSLRHDRGGILRRVDGVASQKGTTRGTSGHNDRRYHSRMPRHSCNAQRTAL